MVPKPILVVHRVVFLGTYFPQMQWHQLIDAALEACRLDRVLISFTFAGTVRWKARGRRRSARADGHHLREARQGSESCTKGRSATRRPTHRRQRRPRQGQVLFGGGATHRQQSRLPASAGGAQGGGRLAKGTYRPTNTLVH